MTRDTADLKTLFAGPANLAALNSAENDTDLTTPDGTQFFFSSNRSGSGYQLYQSQLSGSDFSDPVAVGFNGAPWSGDAMSPSSGTTTSAGTAAATRTGCAASRFRSARASSTCAKPSTP